MRIRTGLIGYGLGGRCFHAPFIHALPEYELAAVLERHDSASARDYSGIRVVRTLDEMLADTDIRLIVVTTPNSTHYDYARKVLEAGRMLVLDKPMTVTSAEAAWLIDYAQSRKILFSVYQSRRFASDARTLEKILSQKKLGSIHDFEAHYDRYRPAPRESWKETEVPGSGILYDLGPHLIDQALHLFGKPTRIMADIRRQRSHARTDDYFDIRMDFGPLKVILKAGMLVREPGPRYLVHGDKGSFIKYGDDPQDAALREGQRPPRANWGQEPSSQFGLLHTEWEGKVIRENVPSLPGNFGIFYEELAKAIQDKGPLPVEPEEGYNAVRLIELAIESNRLQCAVPCEGLRFPTR